MTTLNIKIVGIEDDSVLIKFASENSAKSIDEYDAIAYQPKAMGYTSLDEFIEAIKPGLLSEVIIRDKIESAPAELDLSSWEGKEITYTPENESDYIPPPEDTQVIAKESEVIL
jgi:hypothetical protein